MRYARMEGGTRATPDRLSAMATRSDPFPAPGAPLSAIDAPAVLRFSGDARSGTQGLHAEGRIACGGPEELLDGG